MGRLTKVEKSLKQNKLGKSLIKAKNEPEI